MSEDALLFVDVTLSLKRFTAHAAHLAGVSGGDLDRPILGLPLPFSGNDLVRDVQRVLLGEAAPEREVEVGDGRRLRLSYRPGLSPGEGGGGVVVTLTDVTDVTEDHGEESLGGRVASRVGLRTRRPRCRPRRPRVEAERPGVEVVQRGLSYGAHGGVDGPGGDGSTRPIAATLDLRTPGVGGAPSDIGASDTGGAADEEIAALKRRIEGQAREIRRLNREVTLTEQHERNRLAQLLHDEFQQLLYAIHLRLDAVLEGASLEVHGGGLRELLAQTNALTRTLVASLAPPVHEGEDAVAALEWLADHFAERYGLEVAVEGDRPIRVCDEERRVLLFEGARELLFNVVKHAGVPRARVEVRHTAKGITVTVEDEGRGEGSSPRDEGTVREPRRSRPSEGGFGLSQLRRRLRFLGGALTVRQVPGVGTRASITVPPCAGACCLRKGAAASHGGVCAKSAGRMGL